MRESHRAGASVRSTRAHERRTETARQRSDGDAAGAAYLSASKAPPVGQSRTSPLSKTSPRHLCLPRCPFAPPYLVPLVGSSDFGASIGSHPAPTIPTTPPNYASNYWRENFLKRRKSRDARDASRRAACELLQLKAGSCEREREQNTEGVFP